MCALAYYKGSAGVSADVGRESGRQATAAHGLQQGSGRWILSVVVGCTVVLASVQAYVVSARFGLPSLVTVVVVVGTASTVVVVGWLGLLIARRSDKRSKDGRP